jgi:hypothetical protein
MLLCGGTLVFGMDEDQGLPTKVTGIQAGDVDLAIRRLESILAAGLNPRIKYSMKVINTRHGQTALVIRVDRSWFGPHRVVFQGNDKFYGRNAAGKYPLDVDELRAAFTLSSTVTERIRAFRTDRLIALADNQTPIPFVDTPKVVLHCIPLESFSGQPQYDVLPFQKSPMRLRPMDTDNWNRRLNLDGVIAFETSQPSRAYTQLYRMGVIEAVQGSILAVPLRGGFVIPDAWYEKVLLEYLTYCFRLLQELGSGAPLIVALTLMKTRGLAMADNNYGFPSGYSVDSDTIILPEAVVEDFSKPAGKILKPLVDLVWNACGYPSSKNFDSDGNWIDRR